MDFRTKFEIGSSAGFGVAVIRLELREPVALLACLLVHGARFRISGLPAKWMKHLPEVARAIDASASSMDVVLDKAHALVTDLVEKLGEPWCSDAYLSDDEAPALCIPVDEDGIRQGYGWPVVVSFIQEALRRFDDRKIYAMDFPGGGVVFDMNTARWNSVIDWIAATSLELASAPNAAPPGPGL